MSFGAKSLTWKMWLILDMISLACIITSLGCCGLLTYMTKAAKTEMELQAYQYQQTYYKELNQEFATSTKIYCKNSIINAVLSAKEQLAKDSDISYQFQIDLEDVPAIEDMDLCSLLGNTLDNATEACRVIPKITDRKMTVKARYQHHFFSYQIENTKTNEIHMKNGVIQTSKPDAEGHGIGLQNTKNIVEKYHGDMNISYHEKTFCMTVLIPL